jgi:hypothetical protein
MHQVRPFAPLRVTNTRICSKAAPAPGNSGFEGCLEYLQLQCRAQHRAMTVWDTHAFHHISAAGAVSSVPKAALLQLAQPRLAW